MSEVKYEPRYVAFIDVLGFADFIARRVESREQSSRQEALQQLLGGIRDLATGQRFWQGEYDPNPSVQKLRRRKRERAGDLLLAHTFSDCTVISAADSARGLNWLIGSAVRVCTNLLYWGMITRGGIVRGNLHHDDDCVFGSGMIEAYRLEREVALYPRIAASEEVYQIATATTDSAGRFSNCGEYFRRGSDGVRFLDYVRLGPRHPAANDTPSGWLENLRNVLLEGLTRWRCAPRIHAKYFWLGEQFNRVVGEQRHLGVHAINLAALRLDLGSAGKESGELH